ncbi:Lysine-specific histone demethylase 1 homolog 1 [Linum grandiflorum]
METATEPPPGAPSTAAGDALSDHSSPSTEATPSPARPENRSTDQQNSERLNNNTPSPLPLDSQDESSDPTQLEPAPENPTDPAPPPRKRRRRKRFFTEINNGNPSLRNRYRLPGGRSKELDVEALIAISVGFPADSLTEEEIVANVVRRIGGTEQANYIVVRNHILARWRSNVTDWLTREQAHESIRAEHANLVDSAYDFLLQHGYINFGVANSITEAQLNLNEQERGKANVVIVGAGFAGLVAARQLRSMGFKVVILEGRSRPGGRVKTMRLKGGDGVGVEAAADVGGSVLTGINGNPLGVLARQLELPLHKVRDICPLYLPDGKAVDPEIDTKVEASFNKLLDRVCKLRQAMIEDVKSADVNLGTALEAFRHSCQVAEDRQERMLLNWHLANLEYANASLMSDLSMAYWDQDDPYEMGGDHCFIPGGNETFVKELAKDLPIFYNRVVESIRYGVDGVLVHAGGQEFRSDMVLCTVPLGVLKKGSIEFVPDLPQRKKDAIQRLGYGLLNKVALLFPYDFWGGEIDTFGHLTEDSNMRGEFFLMYSYSSVSGGPLLIALVAGDAAVKFETMSPVESVRRVLQMLRGIFHPKGIVVPDPVQSVCTRWGQDQFTYGSYSYVAVGSSGDDYDLLAESVGDGRVFFAGEATNKQYPATMHGAFLSGMREAANMLRVVKKRSLTPPATNKSNVDEGMDQLYETADLELGCFSILFNPRSNDPDSRCLLRVKIRGGGGGGLDSESCFISLYAVVPRKQAIELCASDGGDDKKRLETLCREFRVRLVGRKGLGDEGESLVAEIKAARSDMDVGI